MIIAIDGPAGAGKSTVCKTLAERLGFAYMDTGAMYRALAWALDKFPAECRPESDTGEEQDRIAGMLERLPLRFSIEENRLQIFCGQRRLSDELRSPEITAAASKISQMYAARQFLVGRQRKLAEQGANIVAEGRDTATVVFPWADLQVFLTADLQTRAMRRFAEYVEKGVTTSLEEIQASIKERDEADSRRDHSPMRPAEKAILLDTSHLEVEQVVDCLSEMAQGLIRDASSAH